MKDLGRHFGATFADVEGAPIPTIKEFEISEGNFTVEQKWGIADEARRQQAEDQLLRQDSEGDDDQRRKGHRPPPCRVRLRHAASTTWPC